MKTFSYQVIQAAQDHITLVSGERAYYKTVCKQSAMALKSVFTDASGHFIVPPPGSCIPGLQHDITVHYSFDFAQQVMKLSFKLCSKKSSESITANLVFTVTQLTFEES